MRKALSIMATALALSSCATISDQQQAGAGKILADGEAVAIHEVPPGPTRTALCLAFEKASAQIGVPLHPAGSPVAPTTQTK